MKNRARPNVPAQLLLLCLVLSFVAVPAIAADRVALRHEPIAPVEEDPSILVLTLDHASPRTPARLWEVFRMHVDSEADERTFFEHPVVAALGAAQQELFDLMAAEDPRRFLSVDRRHETGGAYERFLAHLGAHEGRLIRRVSKLSIEEQLGLYLGGRTDLDGLSRAERRVLSPQRRIEGVLSDPSLAHLSEVEDAWLAGLAAAHVADGLLYVDAKELVQCKVMVARNLHFAGDRPTRDGVRREYARILELRKRYSHVALFSQRDVVYAASDQRLHSSEGYVFGQPGIRDELERQGANLAFLRDGESGTKERLTDELRQARRLTFLFEGHGRPEAILFARGTSAEDFARSLRSRASDGGSPPGSGPSIFIPVTCRAHDLSRSLLGRLDAADPEMPKPIAIVPEEFGQYFFKRPHADPFLSGDLQIGRTSTTTLGTLFERSRLGTSVYVPDERNRTAQIL